MNDRTLHLTALAEPRPESPTGVRSDHAAVEQEAMSPPTTLEIIPWPDPVMDSHGFDPRDPYVERFWLAVLGPSAIWFLRRVARGLDEHPNGFRIDLSDTSKALGLGDKVGRGSLIWRTIDRTCTFGLAQPVYDGQLAVRTHLSPLTRRQLGRLPASLQRAHERYHAELQSRAQHPTSA